MAVVDFGCALDVLSGAAGKAENITSFAEAALDPDRSPAPPNAMSVADAITRIYRDERNKLAHGEASGVLEDLHDARGIGDRLVAHLFDAVTLELADIVRTSPQILHLPPNPAYRALTTRLACKARTGGVLPTAPSA